MGRSGINKGSKWFRNIRRSNIYIKWIWIGKSRHVELEVRACPGWVNTSLRRYRVQRTADYFFDPEALSRLSSALGSVLVALLQLYVSVCPSILEGKVKGSEVWKRVRRSQRSVSEMSVKDNFQVAERRLHYISFILWSKISIKVGVSVVNLGTRHVNEYTRDTIRQVTG